MQVTGNIGTALEKRTTKAGKEFYTFRLAENFGKDENRTTTWYEVAAFISEVHADMLSKGQFVQVSGRLDASTFKRRNGEVGVSVTVYAFDVVPVERKERAAEPA